MHITAPEITFVIYICFKRRLHSYTNSLVIASGSKAKEAAALLFHIPQKILLQLLYDFRRPASVQYFNTLH
jgi:hypothetical protein